MEKVLIKMNPRLAWRLRPLRSRESIDLALNENF